MNNPEANIFLTVEAWAEIVIKEWVKHAAALNIHPEHPLTADRFYHYITRQANGDPVKIEFTFDFYLHFVNWGVGRGITLEDRDTYILSGKHKKYYHGGPRRPKPWYDDVFPKQLAILSHLLSEKYGQRTVLFIKTTLESFNSDGSKVSTTVETSSNQTSSSTRTTSSSPNRKITYGQHTKMRKEAGW